MREQRQRHAQPRVRAGIAWIEPDGPPEEVRAFVEALSAAAELLLRPEIQAVSLVVRRPVAGGEARRGVDQPGELRLQRAHQARSDPFGGAGLLVRVQYEIVRPDTCRVCRALQVRLHDPATLRILPQTTGHDILSLE